MIKDMTMSELQAALDANRVHALFDSRSEASFNQLHIKGAQCLPYSKTAEGLPADKNALLVFY